VHTQFCVPIVALQTDNGTEYENNTMRTFLAAQGTSFRLSCPYTSQQNGKAERILSTINDCIRTLLIHSAAPLSFWVEALNTAMFLINRRPCRTTGSVTPHHLLLGTPPRYDELRTFGCLCYPNMAATTTHKLCPRSVACVFIRYPVDHRGYRCYDIATRRVCTSRHVTFVEHVFPFRDRPSSPPVDPATPAYADDDVPTLAAGSACAPAPHQLPQVPASSPSTASSSSSSPHQTPAMDVMPTSPTLSSSALPPHSNTTPAGHPRSSTVTSTSSPLPSLCNASLVLTPPPQSHRSPTPPASVPPASHTATMSQPIPTPPPRVLPQHPMFTRARAGIFKPNPK
jgi:hypothetical protein